MSRITFRFTIALLTFIIGVSTFSFWFIRSEPQIESVLRKDEVQPKLPINDEWETYYFETINKRAKIANLPNLRTANLPNDDLEVRIWYGFGLILLEGFVIKRSAGEWSSIHLDAVHEKLPQNKYQIQLQSPKSGWEACWKRLTNASILTLPDSSQIENDPGPEPDSESYVVEYRFEGKYRTYHYHDYDERYEGEQMRKIGNIIFEEFGLPEFKARGY